MTEADLLLELTRRYTEPHRRYHDLRHVAELLCLGAELSLSDEQVMAIWFHDAVYDPTSSTNEQDSAQLAVQRLTALGWDDDNVLVVERIVLDTDGHVPSIEDSKPVIDLDLSPLAASWQVYRRNGRNIREEFRHVSEDEWNKGRAKWLNAMLNRENIYWTEWGRPLEKRARANLQRDLASLST